MKDASLVIATRNRGRQLGLALASIREQEYSGLEVILIDDASSDGETETVLKRESGWIDRVERLERDGGYRWNPARVLNRGHELSSCDIVLEQGGEVCHLLPCAPALIAACEPGVVALATVLNGTVRDYLAARDERENYVPVPDWDVGAPVTDGGSLPVPWRQIGGRGFQVFCGADRPVPFLFLGAIHRADFEAVGGYDERADLRNDQGLAEALVARGVCFRFLGAPLAFHLRHGKS